MFHTLRSAAQPRFRAHRAVDPETTHAVALEAKDLVRYRIHGDSPRRSAMMYFIRPEHQGRTHWARWLLGVTRQLLLLPKLEHAAW